MRDIGKNIREFRIRENMTQDDLAEKLYVTRQTVSNYETGKSRPDVEMLVKIGEVLETDIQQLIYGPEKNQLTPEVKRLILAAVVPAVLGLIWVICEPLASAWRSQTFLLGPVVALRGIVKPLLLLSIGWLLGHLLTMALRVKPIPGGWVKYARTVLLILLIFWLVVSVLFTAYYAVDEWLYAAHHRGSWEEITYESEGQPATGWAWKHLPLPGLNWLSRVLLPVLLFHERGAMAVPLLYGGLLRFLETPAHKKTPD